MVVAQSVDICTICHPTSNGAGTALTLVASRNPDWYGPVEPTSGSESKEFTYLLDDERNSIDTKWKFSRILITTSQNENRKLPVLRQTSGCPDHSALRHELVSMLVLDHHYCFDLLLRFAEHPPVGGR